MKFKTSEEKVKIVFDIIRQLKNFDRGSGPEDMYQPHHSYVKECTEIFNHYIKNIQTLTGKLYFKEIDRDIEYHLPAKKKIARFL